MKFIYKSDIEKLKQGDKNADYNGKDRYIFILSDDTKNEKNFYRFLTVGYSLLFIVLIIFYNIIGNNKNNSYNNPLVNKEDVGLYKGIFILKIILMFFIFSLIITMFVEAWYVYANKINSIDPIEKKHQFLLKFLIITQMILFIIAIILLITIISMTFVFNARYNNDSKDDNNNS